MRIRIACLALSLLMVAGASATQTTPAQAAPTPPAPVKNPQAEAQLKEFTGPDGRFSIAMPGTPQFESSAVPLKAGGTVQSNSFISEFDNGNVAYMLMYNDYPADIANQPAADVLQRGKTGAMASAGATLLSENTITLGAVPGLAFTAHTPDGSFLDVHIYYSNGRLYQIMTLAASGYTSTFRDAFMNSFKIK